MLFIRQMTTAVPDDKSWSLSFAVTKNWRISHFREHRKDFSSPAITASFCSSFDTIPFKFSRVVAQSLHHLVLTYFPAYDLHIKAILTCSVKNVANQNFPFLDGRLALPRPHAFVRKGLFCSLRQAVRHCFRLDSTGWVKNPRGKYNFITELQRQSVRWPLAADII